MTPLRPSTADIILAMGRVAADNWPDRSSSGSICATSTTLMGLERGGGAGRAVQEAMAMAWLAAWWDGDDIEPVPLDIPDGWKFVSTQSP